MRVIITQAQRLEVWNLRWGRPHFLQKDDVGALRGQPRRHTFGNRAADAVEVEGDDAHAGECTRGSSVC